GRSRQGPGTAVPRGSRADVVGTGVARLPGSACESLCGVYETSVSGCSYQGPSAIGLEVALDGLLSECGLRGCVGASQLHCLEGVWDGLVDHRRGAGLGASGREDVIAEDLVVLAREGVLLIEHLVGGPTGRHIPFDLRIVPGCVVGDGLLVHTAQGADDEASSRVRVLAPGVHAPGPAAQCRHRLTTGRRRQWHHTEVLVGRVEL